MKLGLIFLLFVNSGFTETRINKLLKWSQATLIVGNTLDITSSYGKQELNPVLKNNIGTFSLSGLIIKTGIITTALLTEKYICKKEEKVKKEVIYINFGLAGVTGVVAVRNWKK